MTDKPHISASQLDMQCGEAFRRRYIEGDIIPPGISLLKGSAVHVGAAANFSQKIESHEDLPASDIIDASVAGFEEKMAGGVSLDPDESSRGEKIVVGEAKDSVVEFAETHARAQAPDYQPVLVEAGFRIELPGKRDYLGYIDIIDDQRRVTDFKTSGRKKSQGDVDDSTQLTGYAAGHKILTGEPANIVQLDVLVQGRKGTDRQLLTSDRSEADFQALAARVNALSAAIEAGVFLPVPPGHWCCSPKWCGYWSTCRFVNSERKAKSNGD